MACAIERDNQIREWLSRNEHIMLWSTQQVSLEAYAVTRTASSSQAIFCLLES